MKPFRPPLLHFQESFFGAARRENENRQKERGQENFHPAYFTGRGAGKQPMRMAPQIMRGAQRVMSGFENPILRREYSFFLEGHDAGSEIINVVDHQGVVLERYQPRVDIVDIGLDSKRSRESSPSPRVP